MDLSGVEWRKATRSLSNGGECVEVAAFPGMEVVRDSVVADGSVLTSRSGRKSRDTELSEVGPGHLCRGEWEGLRRLNVGAGR
ncbi:DUF397 domain-containing protein [Actinoallomurus sp. CA-150999]|uniref:DUF397 domain-containing protein n=1 Tax=Actinoallomurus sp. CA-150999 TaxID=3239887 RepID=UPI003D8DD3D6